jgi:hypothetical protein
MEPGAFAQQPAAPAYREKALAGLARIGQPFLQLIDLAGEQIETRSGGVLLVGRQQPRGMSSPKQNRLRIRVVNTLSSG